MSSSKPGWNTRILSSNEKNLINDVAVMSSYDPYTSLSRFSGDAAHAWAGLAEQTRQLVMSLADGSSEHPALYIDNLPEVKGLPPTPSATQSWARITQGHVSEAVMLTFAVGLGAPISYLDQRGGSVFHDVYPTRGNVAEVSSQSSAVTLGHHTEMFFHPDPPDFLMLHCLRSAPERAPLTGVSSLLEIENALSHTDRQRLREPVFALDLAYLHGSYVHQGKPYTEADPRPCIPMISSAPGIPRFRFEPALVTPTTAASADTLHNAEHAAEQATVPGVLREQGMLIIDNRRAAHSRSSFSAHFDGRDRWLRRMMIGAGQAGQRGCIQHHDLELLASWRTAGANIEYIPYPSVRGRL